MFKTEKVDWYFIVIASLIFFFALSVTLWDFIWIQKMNYRLSLGNIIGLVLFSTGVTIRIVARRTLGKYFSYGLKTSQKHELISRGIYKCIRHPAYLGSLILSPGIPLIFSSFYGFFLMLGLIPCFLYRIKVEESMLIKQFGNEYVEYMKRTKRLIPYVY
jgi:protein-S-isoprenylcysteine O-methyltransferase Ste14